MESISQHPTTKPEDHIRLIKKNLEGYLSSDIAKELIQNADDAGATYIDFIIFEGKNCTEKHLLLDDRPALMVINNGPYKEKDFEAIPNIIGGTKDSSSEQIGRFGLGLKSVYNICELFYHLGSDGENLRGALLNPWHYRKDEPCVTYNNEDIRNSGFKRLRKFFEEYPLPEKKGFLLWLPLSDGTQKISFKGYKITAEELYREVFTDIPFELYLAQCANIKSISLYRGDNLNSKRRQEFEYKKESQKQLWRTNEKHAIEKDGFNGIITLSNSNKKWFFHGIQVYNVTQKELFDINNSNNWPKVPSGENEIPLKAQNHAAITIIHEDNFSILNKNATPFVWASFMPINEKDNYLSESWNIVLHGYFLLTSDRKILPGISKDCESIEAKWNKCLANVLLIPLLPEVLSHSNDKLAVQIIKKVLNADIFKEFQSAITSKNVFAKIANSTDISWQCMSREDFDSKEKYILSLPQDLEQRFVDELRCSSSNALYVLSSKDESLLPQCCDFLKISQDIIKIILDLFLQRIQQPSDLSANILEWLKDFWEETKDSYCPWGEFIITLLKNDFFSKESNSREELVEIIKAHYPKENLRFCYSYKLHDALKNLAKERRLTPELIYLPVGENDNQLLTSDKVNIIKDILSNLIDKQVKTNSDKNLINLLRQDLDKIGVNPREIFCNQQCILVNDILVSYEDIDKFRDEYRIFRKPSVTQKEPWINTHLTECLKQNVYILDKEDYTLGNIAEVNRQSIVQTILLNEIHEKPHKNELIEILFGEDGEVSLDTKNAIRKLICSKNVEGLELIVFPSDKNYSFLKELEGDISVSTVFLEEEIRNDLTPRQLDVLEIKDIEKNSESFLTTIVEALLDKDSSWKYAEHIKTCLRDLQSVEKIKQKLLSTSWIPFQGEGVPLGKIFIECPYSRDLIQLDFVQKMEWSVVKKEEIIKYIPSKHRDTLLDEKAQLENFRSDCAEFFNKEHSGVYALFSNHFTIDEELIATFIDNISFAWDSVKLLQIAKKYELGYVDFAQIFPKNVTKEKQQEILTFFSNIEKLNHKNIRDFYDGYLTSCVLENRNIFSENPNLFLPTRSNKQGEKWRNCNEILLTSRDDGNSSQLLYKKLWDKWDESGIIGNLEYLYQREDKNIDKNSNEAYVFLKNYFTNYTGEHARISLFLALLYKNNVKMEEFIESLCPSKKWREKLDDIGFEPHIPIKILRNCVENNKGISFAGKSIQISKDANKKKNLFSKDPVYNPPSLQGGSGYWIIYFETESGGVSAPRMTNEEFAETLFNTVLEWLKVYRRKDRFEQEIENDIKEWWNAASPTQVSVESTCNRLRTELPYILKILKLDKNSSLGMLHTKYDKQLQDEGRINEALLKEIWDEARNDTEVGKALANKVSENGYKTSSVLFELLQNADDAILQAKELNDFKKKECVRQDNHVKIKYDTTHRLYFFHNGRPINEGGDHNPEWESDLGNMVNFNVSYKNPQHDSNPTTGMFGLGFKSVHLISDLPEVYSGNLHFRIKNTLFPQSEADLDNKDSLFSTQFILPLKNEITAEEVFSKLGDMYRIIPVTCQGINRLEIESDVNKVKTCSVEYNPVVLLNCSDKKSCWKICYNCNVLVFETKVDCGGIVKLFSLAFNIKTQGEQVIGIINFEKTPFLWNTMPTQEEWECKYIFNGFFKLNPGRTHVDIQDEHTLKYIKFVGENLGYGLCEIYEIKNSWSTQVWADLWNILSGGLTNEKTDRAKFLHTLHCGGRGLSCWTNEKKIVASGLKKPFSPLATLGNEKFIHDYYVEEGIKGVIEKNNVNISHFININKGVLLEALEYKDRNSRLYKEIEFYENILFLICNNKMSAGIFHSLLPALNKWPESHAKKDLLVKTQAGNYKKIQQVLMTRPKFQISSIEYEEEFLRAEFAPPENILHEDYLLDLDHIKLFIRLRWRHIIDSKLLMQWALRAEKEKRYHVLHYIQHGELSVGLVDKLEEDDNRSAWIYDFEHVSEINQGKFERVLLLLFPSQYEPIKTSAEVLESIPVIPKYEVIHSDIDIEKIEDRIKNEQIRDKCWPDSFTDELLLSNLEDNDTKTWCTLLLLGCMQSLGRQNPYQHKGFINKLISGEIPKLWDKFITPKGNKHKIEWIESLDDWFDTQTNSQEYSEWMLYFVSMYQINKYIGVYSKLFTDLPVIANKNGSLNLEENFSIRVNPEYSSGGKRCDAPPLPLKIGKYWVIRELARLGFEGYRNKEMLQYCWTPKTRVLEMFDVQYGFNDKSHVRHQNLINKLKEINNGTIPHFNYNFDLALNLKED